MSCQLKGTLFIVTGTILWGASGVLSQHLFVDKIISAEWLVTVRLILSGITLLSIDAILNKGDIFSIWHTKDKFPLICFGIFGMLGVQYTYFGTIIHSNAATATILQYLMPIVIVFYLLFTTHRLPSFKELFSIFLAMVGTFFLVTKGNFSTLTISLEASYLGTCLCLLCCLLYITTSNYYQKMAFHTNHWLGYASRWYLDVLLSKTMGIQWHMGFRYSYYFICYHYFWYSNSILCLS